MGWIEFVKIFGNEKWAVYKYSHDCCNHDGIIKIKEVKEFSDDNIVIIPSKSDISHNTFALRVVSPVYK